MRAIDADKLCTDLVARWDIADKQKDEIVRQVMANIVTPIVVSQPTIEPEIVRCKDCRYYQDNNGGYPHMNCKWDANETPDEDDFCSGAERNGRRTDE